MSHRFTCYRPHSSLCVRDMQLRSGLNFDLTDPDHEHTSSPTGAVRPDMPPNGMPVVLLRNDCDFLRYCDVSIRVSRMWVCMAVVDPAPYPNGAKIRLGGHRDYLGDARVVDAVGGLADT